MANYTQARQNLKVFTELDEDILLARRFAGVERISAPFEFELDLLSEDPNLDDRQLLRTEMVVSVDGLRVFRGWVRSFSQSGQAADLTMYKAVLVPRLWFLNLSSDSRIFRDMTIPEVIRTVLEEQGIDHVSMSCTGDYERQDFLVQYRETHFDFISRLMEDQGIFYFFKHTEEACQLVIADHRGAHRDVEPSEFAELSVGTRGSPDDGIFSAGSIVLGNHVHTKRVTVRDVDTEQSLDPIEAMDEARSEAQEEYDYPAGFVKREGDRGEELARVRVEEHESEAANISGISTLPLLEAGRRFTLSRHYRRDANRKYLVTSVRHQCSAGSYLAGAQADEGEYVNSFTGIPDDVPFRPRRVTPRPAIHGAHPARVVGGAADEIHVDSQGRVKVQFFWDRRGELDENSSCWIHVAQGWAGANRGMLAIPRVGDEVMVVFAEGDPDRPYIIGSLYNEARSTIPWDLPSEATMTGLRSLTSRGGGGMNEISVDDKAGSERIYIHGQKNMDTKVLNNQSNSVDVNHSETIGNNSTRSIGNDDTHTIGNDQKTTVGNDQGLEVGANRKVAVGVDQSVSVGSNHALSAGLDSTMTSGTETKIEAGTDLIAAANVNADVSAGVQIEIKAGVSIKLSAGAGVIEIGPSGVKITGPTIALSGFITHN